MKIPKLVLDLISNDPVKALRLSSMIRDHVAELTTVSHTTVDDAHFRISEKIAHLNYERYCCAIYDSGRRFKKLYLGPEGDNDSTNLFLRPLFKEILGHDGQVIVLAHNHPSGSLLPSKEDLEGQKVIKSACSVFGISDIHMIVTATDMFIF